MADRSGQILSTVELPVLFARAELSGDTINAQARTVEVVFSTGARAVQSLLFERFYEELSLDPKHVRMGRLTSGRAPVLAAHRAASIDSQIGVVESARVDRGVGYATLRFAKDDPAADAVWNKIEQRILRNISVGYLVHKYEKGASGDADLPLMRAVDWEPYEISVVPMPADAGAHIRSDHQTQTNPCVIVTRAAKETPAMDHAHDSQPPDMLLDPGAPIPPPQPPVVRSTEPSDLEVGADIERERVQAILRGCSAVRLPMSFAEKLIADKVPIAKAQAQILDTLRSGAGTTHGPQEGPTGVQVGVVGTDPLENVWRGIENAVLHKIDPHRFKLEDIGRPYRTRALLTSAEMCLQHRGMRTTDMPRTQVAGLALGLSQRAGYHTTSDFAGIFENVGRKLLRRSYEEAAPTWGPITRRVTLSDFKPLSMNQLGEFPALLKVLEHGEFRRGTVVAGKETMILQTWGRVFGITRQALINDDLDAFSQLARGAGASARNMESDLVWAEITNNAAMGDGIPLFHASHRNLSATGAVLSIDSIGKARAAMRNQLSLDGVTRVNVTPRYLVVPPSLETLAEQLVRVPVTPAQTTNANPFTNTLQVISEPRLEANSAIAWYMMGDPGQLDIILTGFLDGEEGPMVESRVGFDIDALEIKCRQDFAAKASEFRGMYKNLGA